MRVGYEATALLGQRTGVGEFCYNALVALAALPEVDLRPFAVSWRRRNRLATSVSGLVPIRQLPMPARPLQASWSRFDFPWVELFTGPLDVVHGTNFVVPPSLRARRVVTVHDLTPLLYPNVADPSTLVFPRLIARAIRGGAFVHTPSAFVAAQVVEHFSADPERVVAVPHGLPDVPEIGGNAEDGADAGIAARLAGAPYVLGLGTIEPRKGFATLVDAFADLGDRHPDLRLVIAGQPGWGSEEVLSRVEANPHRSRILLPGYVSSSERFKLLARASVFAYPSIYEGFGLPPIEAMALGTPVVASLAGSLPEVLGDGAELVPAGDASALAAALARVLEDSALREALVARATVRISGYSWVKTAKGLAALYAKALAA
ncbi:MAG: glycosyltransferase family 1 protein [Nitrospiraceae bacterium]|nr:glycosyltransferase family 1 protein [Nitrospiraceae bacterium]MDA8262052.1 glycosyltransferase family 1 protein [Actinomycetota bacterium]